VRLIYVIVLGLSGQATSAALLALCVRFFDCKMRTDTIVTGHLTLNGIVLAVGGVNAKIKGAKACGYYRMVIPHDCLEELSDECRNDPDIEIVTARDAFELLNQCLDGFRK
jgi:predicted ATP-dependent protease